MLGGFDVDCVEQDVGINEPPQLTLHHIVQLISIREVHQRLTHIKSWQKRNSALLGLPLVARQPLSKKLIHNACESSLL